MTRIINLFGGPGTGKSTTAAGLFNVMKVAGLEVELVTEYAKDVVWEETTALLDNQLHVFAEQHRRIARLNGKVDFVITDSPLLLSLLYYAGTSVPFRQLVLEEFKGMPRVNVFLRRVKEYHRAGRLQNEQEAIKLDGELRTLLGVHDRIHFEADADHTAHLMVFDYLREVGFVA